MTPLRPHSGGGVRALREASAEPIAPELRIRTLGAPQVWLGEIALTFRRRKSLALLVYLALTGRGHGREALASLFVDRARDAQARAQFRTTLTGLVEQVGAFLLVTRETIALDRAQPYWLDADELQAATMGPSEGAAAADPQRLERAVALYEGAFLSGFALHDAPLFEDWMQEQRARLERLHVQALQLLLERAREGGDEEAALRWTTRLLAAEPWQEEAHRQLMRLLARRGQRQAALEQYAVCCRVDEAAALSGDVPAPQALQAAIAHWRGRIGYLQRNVPAARHASDQALALARMAGARDLEAHSLWQLGRQALALFQAQGNRLGEAFVTHELGTSAFEQGHMMAARCCFDEALRFCRTFGCRSCVPFACTGLGLVYDQGLGRHKDAEPYFAEALALWRAMGFRPNDESCLLAYQGRSALAQGDQPRAQVLFTQALRTARAAGDLSAAVGRTWALHGLGLLAHYTGDERAAEQLARQALRIARGSWQPRTARFALRLLGHALFGLGTLEQAQSAYRQVLEIDQTLGYPHLAVEATTDLARVALAQGSIAQAVAHVAGILADVQTDALNGAEEPVLVYLTCYQVLRAAGDPRAESVLTAGYSLLSKRAAQFVDDERRAQFLDNLPAHRTLLHAWRDYRRWTMGAGEHDADAGMPPRAFDNRQRTPLRIVRREESS